MWNFKAVFRSSAKWTMLESFLLAALREELEPETAALFARQLDEVNLIQRQSNQREICCYSMKNGKPHRNPELQFPANSLELKFAKIKFQISNIQSFTVEFVAVNGLFFSIIFDRQPPEIGAASDVQIESVKLFGDLMVAPPTISSKRAIAGSTKFSGWLREWELKYQVEKVFEALSQEDRNRLIQNIDTKLPIDYLELVEQCEGFTLGDSVVLGLSQGYEIVLPNSNYFVLAEIEGRGVLAVQSQNGDGRVGYFDYDAGSPEAIYGSFREAMKTELRKLSG